MTKVNYSITNFGVTYKQSSSKRAIVYQTSKWDTKKFIEEYIKRFPNKKPQEVTQFIEEFSEVFSEGIAQGNAISLPFMETSLSIKGNFRSHSDNFNPNMHSINLILTPTSQLKNRLTEIVPTKIPFNSKELYISDIIDATTKEKNKTITPLGAITIMGYGIKIAGDNPNVGLYFISSDKNSIETGIVQKVIHFASNRASEIITVVPNLTSGFWIVKIITQYKSGRIYKTVREHTFNKSLWVK